MLKVIYNLIAMIIGLIGTICVFEAREVVKKYFSFEDNNIGTRALKTIGFIICVIGLAIIKFNYIGG